MGRISEKYRYQTTPVANKKAIVQGKKYRFTILTDGLIRMEYNENGIFEDRATQVVLNRQFPLVEFAVKDTGERIEIRTGKLTVIYYKEEEFSKHSLYGFYHDKTATKHAYWHYNHFWWKEANLRGTVRTLDHINGETELDEGLMSLFGYVQLDDSRSFVLAEDGWPEKRTEQCVDSYLFAYKNDHYGALQAFYTLTGNVPLLPRYALGNMWSRYWKYTQQEYLSLMERFEQEGYPFSVAVLDMEWHLTEASDTYGLGWTGYTWNEELFPDYKVFLREMKEKGYAVTLNLHPADGIRPNEKIYPQMAEAMGITDGSTVDFDMCKPEFVENYFKIVHNPYEEDGVDFWWPDWQQGTDSRIPGLDPLWQINHFHTLDMIANGKRPMLLSRYAGPGSHRYPMGFSGDTYATWESLDFQPYFNATAANIGYAWWSNDIGGFKFGIRDDELYSRWIQLGVFSHASRLHSNGDPMLNKAPWNYGEMAQRSAKKFLNLRHALIPYLYTMNHAVHKLGQPLTVPLYYKHPKESFAYDKKYKNEYYFGSQMLVAPITRHSDSVTQMGSSLTYIPEGVWYDFFNGRRYAGGKELRLYRDLVEMPVLVKAGGIVPMAQNAGNDISNPKKLKVRVFAGADNSFGLYEDDGKTLEYQNGAFAITEFTLSHGEKPVFTVIPPKNKLPCVPQSRSYEIEFVGYSQCGRFCVFEDGKPKAAKVVENTVYVEDVSGKLEIAFAQAVDMPGNDQKALITKLLLQAQTENAQLTELYEINQKESGLTDYLLWFDKNTVAEDLKYALLEILMAEHS